MAAPWSGASASRPSTRMRSWRTCAPSRAGGRPREAADGAQTRRERDSARRRPARGPPADSPMMRVLEVVGLAKRFGDLTALDAVSFTAEAGQIIGLCGPAGAGKTVALDCLSGFTEPDGGRVIVDGYEVTRLSPAQLARAGVGRTFQNVRPVGAPTAAEAVARALARGRRRAWSSLLRSWRGAERWNRARELLERVGLVAD